MATAQEFNLEEYLYVLWRRKWLVVLPLVVILPLVYLVDSRRIPLYEAHTVIELTQQQVGVSDSIREETAFTRNQNFSTLLYVLTSREFLEQALSDYGRSIAARYSAEERKAHGLEIGDTGSLARGLTLQIVNTTNLIRVLAVDDRPLRCSERVNIVTESLKEFSKTVATKNLAEVQSLLERQLKNISTDLQDLESRITAYKSDTRLISIAAEQGRIQGNISRLAGLISQTELQLQELKGNLAIMQGKPSLKDIGLLDDPGYRRIQDHLITLDSQLSALRSQYTDAHPSVEAKIREIASVREQLTRIEQSAVRSHLGSDAFQSQTESMKSQIKLLEDKLGGLNASLEEEQARLSALPAKEVHLGDLERRKRIFEDLYVDTSKKFREIQVAILSRESDVKILELATPPTAPFSPQVRRDLLYAFWASLAAGLLLVFAVEHVARPLNTPAQVEELLGVKNLGNIARIDTSQFDPDPRYARLDAKLVSLHEPQSLLNDSYRKIRTNLMTLGFGEEKSVLLITSSQSGEGKSLTVANLAANFANIGRRTLIIDGDLRTPHQGGMLDRSDDRGILQALKSQAPVEDFIVATDVPNLSLLPAGKKDRDFVEALSSPRLEQILVQLRRAYDIVVIDTPPLELVADGLLLAPHCDGTLLVVSLGVVSSPAVLRSLNALLNVNARIAGAVANLHKNPGRYGYGYGYGAYAYRYRAEKR